MYTCVYTTAYYDFQIYSLDCGVTTCSKGFVSVHNWRVFAQKEACENNGHPEERFGYGIMCESLGQTSDDDVTCTHRHHWH